LQLLAPRTAALADGLEVRRVLPQRARRSVGPFVFLDHFGPVTLPVDADSDVGPHPHIGLATVSYLFEGGFLHRDSLGTTQEITPGAINWMSAGRGIVHSERTPAAERGHARRLHGLQLWVALPREQEESAPTFQHVPAAAIPEVDANGARVRVLVGSALGVASPVRVLHPTLYLDIELRAGVKWQLPAAAEELALYTPFGALEVDGEVLPPATLGVLDGPVTLTARETTRFVVLGGAPLDGPRAMWWNFVASDPARLEVAARTWAAGGFEPISGDSERVPMPAFVARPRA